MFYRSSPIAPNQRRPGVVLLVVMAMLALFASLALSFVFYADSEAVSAAYSVSALTRDVPDVDPEVLMGYFLSKFIYDDNDPYSAGRGWSLARSMYGYNPAGLNFTPYNGAGRSSLSPNPVAFGTTNVDYANLINYQQYSAVGVLPWAAGTSYVPSNIVTSGGTAYVCIQASKGNAPATSPTFWQVDPLLAVNAVRTPEYFGKQGDAAYRFIGGANPPWTAYDTNNLFLAQMTADGTVMLPSFSRPWNANGIPATSAAQRYASLFPDPVWNPQFYPLPDTDPFSGLQVKNLDFGPMMNDSNWMDWGFPIMTAANGKRYKALFAPLIVDLSNRLHLWAHGNNLGGTTGSPPGVSNQGFGPPDVNLNALPGVRIAIASATEKGGKVTVTTSVPHGLTTGQSVMIGGVNIPGYDGTYTITVPKNSPYMFTYADPTKKQAAASNGYVYNLTMLAELQALYNLRYGAGGPGNLTTWPACRALAGGTSTPGTWLSMVNANGLDSLAGDGTVGMSNTSPYLPFQTTTKTAVTTITAASTVQVNSISNLTPTALASPLPWGIEVGMFVTINDGTANNAEIVQVTAVNYAVNPPTFTAKFGKKHVLGATVSAGYQGFPTYPASWGNASAAELTNNPLAFNLYLPNSTLSMSHQEALLRWSGTNGPALTSSPFRLMPTTFSNMRTRNMVTLQNWYLDRVTSVPYLNFNSSTTPQYGFVAGMPYAMLGINEIQTVAVTGTKKETFTLTFNGKTTAPALKVGSSAATVQAALQKLTTIGKGNVGVSLATTTVGTPPVTTYTYTITFAGTLGNVDVAQLTGASANGATVQTATQQNGQPPFSAPNFAATPIQTPPAKSDFTTDWRSALSQNLRVDLTRTLREYPAPAANGLIANTAAGSPFDLAQKDRQQFATDIYNALIRATGARDPNILTKAQLGKITNTSPDYQAARWLAQLAVNIVDYIDDDDYMTPFNWNATAAATASTIVGTTITSEYLFGTELPRLVLNETYVQMEAQTQVGQTPVVPVVPGQVNVWAELFNPFKATPTGSTYPIDGGNALLQVGTTPAYTIEVYKSSAALTSALNSSTLNNPTGAAPLGTIQALQNNWGAIAPTQQVLPANGATSGGTIVTKQIDPTPIGAIDNKKGVVTIRTTTPHGLTVGAKSPDIGKAITISGVPVVGYDGTFLITAVPSKTTFDYAPTTTGMASSGSPAAPGTPATATYVKTDAATGNYGFYVVGPANALYSATTRPPNLPATYVSTGMSFAAQSVTISPAAANGATNAAGPTVTITATGALPADFVVGATVVIQGVTTTNAAKVTVAATGYNGNWIIQSINNAGNSFTATPAPGFVPGAFPATQSGGGTATVAPAGVTLLLRRLANPHLPFNATTNPYITVDFVDGIPVNTQAPTADASVGRYQPYAANASIAWAGQINAAALLQTNTPQTTFFSQNSNAGAPFDWLVHLDRPPVNPIELLHVSGHRPHELTQLFVAPNPVTGVPMKFQHYAPWNPMVTSPDPNAPNALIYRALDQMSTRYMAGAYTGGRFPGNINLNTITEPEIFQALCDAHDATSQYPNAWFTQQDVNLTFLKLVSSRDGAMFLTGTTNAGSANVSGLATVPAGVAGAPTTPVVGTYVFGYGIPPGTTVTAVNAVTSSCTLSQNALATSSGTLLYFVNPTASNPFKSFSAAKTNGTQVSFNDTWFRPDPMNPALQLFTPNSAQNNPSAHPYLQSALLQKIYNNISTTSNVFAVHWTVGFFEVVDETVKPARLGQEIGRAQNRHIRHRFFAIVDRSGMHLYNTTSAANANGTVTINTAKAIPQSATLTYTAPAWSGTQAYVPGNIVAYPAANPTGGYCCITPNTNAAPTGLATDPNWQAMVQAGMLMNIDSGNANAEVVTVQSASGMTFTANFVNSHGPGAAIFLRGNPGPRVTYNPNDDRGVVLHTSVIK